MINAGASGCTDIAASKHYISNLDGVHVVVLKGDAVYACGNNDSGQLGDNTYTERHELTAMVGQGTSGVSKISAGLYTSHVIKSGVLYSTGDNSRGQLGTNGGSVKVLTAAILEGSSGVTAVSGGNRFTVILKTDAVYAAGENLFGALGNNNTGPTKTYFVPMVGQGTSGCTAISAGKYHTVVLKGAAVYCTGYNAYGQLGDNTTTDRPILTTSVGQGTSGCTSISAGDHETWVLKTNSIFSCGDNTYGQLGDGTTTQRNMLTAMINNGSTYVSSLSGGYHFAACLRGYKPYSCGINDKGQLADTTTVNKSEMTESVF